jgi:hypothetical protein
MKCISQPSCAKAVKSGKPVKPAGLTALSAGTVSRTVCDRISTGHTNRGKKNELADHFNRVMDIKNALSEFLMEYWMRWNDADFKTRAEKIFAHRLRYMQPVSPIKSDGAHPYIDVLTAWEFQKLYRDIVFPKAKLAFDITWKKSKLVVRKPINWTIYNAAVKYRKSHAPSSLKSTLNTVRGFLRDRALCSGVILPDYLPSEVHESWQHYCVKYGEARLLALLELNKQNFLKRLKAPVFMSGSYIKAAQFNKASQKPVWHSYWKQVETNSRYKDWYCFKSPQFADRENSALYLPLMVNYGYHNKDYDLRKEHYVSLNAKGEVGIGLVYTDEVIMPTFGGVIGIDANIKHNQLADSQGRMTTMDQGEWIAKALPVFEKHEKKGTANLTHQELRTQQKLNAERDCLIKQMIGETLRYYKAQGITDVIVEQLTFYREGSGSKTLNKMLRRFRLSTLKRWFREQAHKLGMRVHDLPSAYSSQACECGHVDSSNRKTQEVFLCTECGATANRFVRKNAKGACANEVDNPSDINADTHAAGNIERLFEYARDVLLLKGLVSINEYGEYCSTKKAYEQYSLLKDIYKNLTHTVFNAVLGSPNLLPLGRGS